MGFSRGNDVFEPVARVVIRKAEKGIIDYVVAEEILTALIGGLQNIDWDTEDESLNDFSDYPFIVSAFETNGVYLEDEDEEDEEDDFFDEDEDDEDEDEDEEVTPEKV